MALFPQPYLLSEFDTQSLIRLGYTVNGTGGITLDEFINRHFQNFNILSLVGQVENWLSPLTSLPIVRVINFDVAKMELGILHCNRFNTEDDALVFQRTFQHQQEIVVSHDYFVLPAAHRSKGMAKLIFQASLQQYVNMGVKTITVHAGLSGGGYTWSKHGFVAVNRDEVEKILGKAQNMLSPADFSLAEHIFSRYYRINPGGRAFPMVLWAQMEFMKNVLLGTDWYGELDLKNPEQFSNFESYVYRS